MRIEVDIETFKLFASTLHFVIFRSSSLRFHILSKYLSPLHDRNRTALSYSDLSKLCIDAVAISVSWY